MRREMNEAAQTSLAWRVRTHCSYGKRKLVGGRMSMTQVGLCDLLVRLPMPQREVEGVNSIVGAALGHKELEQIGPEKTAGSRQSCCTG